MKVQDSNSRNIAFVGEVEEHWLLVKHSWCEHTL